MLSLTHKIPGLFKTAKDHQDILRFLLLLGVLIAYFGYLSWEYGLASGGLAAALTWSFFVLCTPIADAGFLLDFPVRLIVGLRMMYTEIMVWILAGGMNFAALSYSPDSYGNTALTRLLKEILLHPWPYWSIIALCATGTFVSIIFGDHVYDAAEEHMANAKSKKSASKIKMAAMIALFIAVFGVYYHLVQTLGIEKIIEGS